MEAETVWCLSSFRHTTEIGKPYFFLKFLERRKKEFEKSNVKLSTLQASFFG